MSQKESQTVISLDELASVLGGRGVTFGSPTTITSSPWSNQNVTINNNTYGAGVRPPGMPLYEFRKLNPGFVPPVNRPIRPLGQ
jgi:hypothetical protein